MKKHILLILAFIIFPYLFCVVASCFSSKIRIGQGDNTVEHHKLGKDVLIEINGLYKTMDVEEYVLGVLPGTMSAEYDIEALKVQAILIRTNVLKEMQEKGSTDASDLSYQYLTVEERHVLFGERNYERYNDKYEKAVVATAGQVLRQEGNLIMALYHEVSIGKTANATEVLGEEISYLQSVDSSQDVEAKHYMNEVSYTWEELQEIEQSGEMVTTDTSESDSKQEEKSEEEMSEEAEQSAETEQVTKAEQIEETAKAEEQPAPQVEIQVTEATENGFVKQLSVGGIIYTGEEAMEKYGLSSTNFYVEQQEKGVRFVCLGKGNCLGVSQYGANCMALTGKQAEEIIDYYYKKVTLEDYRK